jgi:hypothetical protein
VKKVSAVKAAIIAGSVALSLATGTAHAGWDYECAKVIFEIGFLNVRARPSIRSRVLGKIEQGHILYLNLNESTMKTTKDWAFVLKVPGTKLPEDWGWVSKQYLDPVDCERPDFREVPVKPIPLVPDLPTIGDQ